MPIGTNTGGNLIDYTFVAAAAGMGATTYLSVIKDKFPAIQCTTYTTQSKF